ncbi:DUF4114 domain-containing protein [Dulcicalothrix desertica]|uniref:DUF4114 domain-containing protein n=1 Tax=Dulcicalothrix desertica TaxID=32056 RepID=UPI002278EA6A|nr:DUF4114 domain-containing protein [Dulcicalothrix desertica]
MHSHARALQTPPISTFLCTWSGANTDKVDHIRLLGNNTFGFEDLANGGDKDYNDIIVKANLTLV